MIIAALLFGLSIASQMVPFESRSYSDVQHLTIDSAQDCNPYASSAHSLTVSQMRKQADRMCAIWGRSTLSHISCRAKYEPEDLVDGAWPDGVSGVSFPGYSMSALGAVASRNYYYVTPFTNEADLMWFCDTKKWFTCETGAGYPPASGCTTSADCKSGQSCTASLCSNTCPAVGGETLTHTSTNTVLSLHEIGLHEWGHLVGMAHATEGSVCGFSECDLSNPICPAGATCTGFVGADPGEGKCFDNNYSCPVMTSGNNDAFWPTSDDTNGVRSSASLVLNHFNMSSAGTLTAPSQSSCAISGVETWSAPHISCKPTTSSTGADCAFSWRPSKSGGVSISFVNTPAPPSACNVTVTAASNFRSDSPVPLAWGSGGLVVGVGVRPPDVSERPGELIIYKANSSGTVSHYFPRKVYEDFDASIPDDPPLNFLSSSVKSYVEPAISYHESNDTFVIVYTTINSDLMMLVLDGAGNIKQSSGRPVLPRDTTFDTVLPAEVACDSHLPETTSSCWVYFAPTSADANVKAGSFVRVQVTFVSTLTIVDTDASDTVSPIVSLLINAGTHGNGAVSPTPSSGYWVNANPFQTTSSEEIRFLHDSLPDFETPFSSTAMSLTQVGYGSMQPNMSSFDWNETIGMFTTITAR